MKALGRLMMVTLVGAISAFAGSADDEYAKWYGEAVEYVKRGDLESAHTGFTMALVYKPGDANAEKGLSMTEERLQKTARPAPMAAAVHTIPEEEEKKHAVIVSVGNAPGADDVEFEYSGSGPMNEDGGYRAEVIYVRRHLDHWNPSFGWSYGGGLFLAQHEGTYPSGVTFDASAFGALGQVGLGGTFGKNWLWTSDLYLGLGVANVDTSLDPTSGVTIEDTGSYGLFGLKGGVAYLIGDRVQIGAEVAYESFAVIVDVSDMIGTEEMTVSGAGPRVALTVGYAF